MPTARIRVHLKRTLNLDSQLFMGSIQFYLKTIPMHSKLQAKY